MAPKTVQQLFGLKPEELNALTVLSGLEGYRGGQGQDVAAVAANALARRLRGEWGGTDIRNIAKAPGQYVAVDNYNMQQLSDPAFGARVLGSEAEFNRLRNIVNNPSLVGEQFRRSKGAQSFRGTAAYGNRKPGDYMPIPGKSNFYFNPLGASEYQRGVQLFNQAGQQTAGTPATPSAAQASTPREKGNILGGQFLQGMLRRFIPAMMQRQSSEAVNPYADVASIDPNLLQAQEEELMSYMQGMG